jgi:Luciferase-like monooxygenase
MRFGLLVQMTGVLGYSQPLARAAEAAGWDGFFIWDVFGGDSTAPSPVVDPWIALAAIAATTERIRSQRPSGVPIDVMVGGDAPFDTPERARAILADYAAAGVTWWMEGIGAWRGDGDA